MSERRLQQVARNSVGHQTGRFALDDFHKALLRARLCTLQLEQRHGHGLRIHEERRRVATDARVEHRALDRRFVAAHQGVHEHVGRKHALEIARVANRVAQAHARVFGSGRHGDHRVERHVRLALAHRVGLSGRARRAIVGRKVAAVEESQHVLGIDVAVEHDIGIVQAIVARVGVEIALVGELRNGARMAARFEGVARTGEQLGVHAAVQHAFGIGQRAFHFVEHHAVVAQALGRSRLGVRVVEFVMPAFLLKHRALAVDRRVQHGVHVHVGKVFEVLVVGAGHGVHSFIGECERVEKRLHRGFQQIDERLFHREFIGTAQHRMLQNVEHARVVDRRSFERDGERLVLVGIMQKQQAGAAFSVAHHNGVAVDFAQRLDRFYREAVYRSGLFHQRFIKKQGTGALGLFDHEASFQASVAHMRNASRRVPARPAETC